LIREQLLDQSIARNDRIGAEQQEREKRSLLRAAKTNRCALDQDLERPENPEL
jgi:hypothetical protein